MKSKPLVANGPFSQIGKLEMTHHHSKSYDWSRPSAHLLPSWANAPQGSDGPMTCLANAFKRPRAFNTPSKCAVTSYSKRNRWTTNDSNSNLRLLHTCMCAQTTAQNPIIYVQKIHLPWRGYRLVTCRQTQSCHFSNRDTNECRTEAFISLGSYMTKV